MVSITGQHGQCSVQTPRGRSNVRQTVLKAPRGGPLTPPQASPACPTPAPAWPLTPPLGRFQAPDALACVTSSSFLTRASLSRALSAPAPAPQTGPSLALKQPHLLPCLHESLQLSQFVMASCVMSRGQLPLSHREPPRGLEEKGRLPVLDAEVDLAHLPPRPGPEVQ